MVTRRLSTALVPVVCCAARVVADPFGDRKSKMEPLQLSEEMHATLKRLGAHIRTRDNSDEFDNRFAHAQVEYQLVLGRDWSGGDEGLAHLARSAAAGRGDRRLDGRE